MLAVLLALALQADPPAGSAPADAAPRPANVAPIPLPAPAALGTPFATPPAPAAGEPPPAEVAALLAPGRTLVEARQADLDLDGSPEWILVASYLHPDRIDFGPRSAEWRGGQRIESRATHELVIAGREKGAWRIRFTTELRGGERQALLVEPLARADGRPARLPVVITGARACAGTCGPVELHLVVWDAKRRAFGDYAWTDAAYALVTAAGTVEAWFADRRPGDPLCCPSGYTVMELAAFGAEIDVVKQRTVPADRLRRLLPPGGLVERAPRPPGR